MRLATASELKALPNGKPARTAGIVTCRQRPGTAQGVVFVTLEDETGYTNVVVWNDLVERQRKELIGARLLGVEGYMQNEGGVVHLVARRLIDHSRAARPARSPNHAIFIKGRFMNADKRTERKCGTHAVGWVTNRGEPRFPALPPFFRGACEHSTRRRCLRRERAPR